MGTFLYLDNLKVNYDNIFHTKQSVKHHSSHVAINLSAGRYYVTARALNKVEYGGMLSTTFCHSTPYIIDTTNPIIYEIYDIKYKEHLYEVSVKHNST